MESARLSHTFWKYHYFPAGVLLFWGMGYSAQVKVTYIRSLNKSSWMKRIQTLANARALPNMKLVHRVDEALHLVAKNGLIT
ncbi:MAG: hypothetical protein AAF843_01665 [Bacteroidota bacterium]